MAIARNLNARLLRLERSVAPTGCPACSHRRGLSYIRSCDELEDGSRLYHRGMPQPCPACNEVPEQIVVIVEEIVECPGEPPT
jgi:hypothetical protein